MSSANSAQKVELLATLPPVEGYLTVQEAADKWEISRRRVLTLCKNNRIPYLHRFGKEYAIPVGAEQPSAARVIRKKTLFKQIEKDARRTKKESRQAAEE